MGLTSVVFAHFFFRAVFLLAPLFFFAAVLAFFLATAIFHLLERTEHYPTGHTLPKGLIHGNSEGDRYALLFLVLLFLTRIKHRLPVKFGARIRAYHHRNEVQRRP